MIEAYRTQSLSEYESISYEYGYLLDKDHVRLLDSSDYQKRELWINIIY
jgi:hypothetical protein